MPLLPSWPVVVIMVLLVPQVEAATAAQPPGPPFNTLPPAQIVRGTNACSELSQNVELRGQAMGKSGERIKYLGVQSDDQTCWHAAASWRNATVPTQRCLSACFFAAPQNKR